MIRNLQKRLRKLESILPPLLTDEVSWIFGLLWFSVAYYLGNPEPDEKPAAAYARALGYANEFELNSAMQKNYRDVSNRVYHAEDKVCAKFGIHIPSLEDGDSKKLSIALVRMETGLPQSYKNELKMVLTRESDLGWKRVHSDNVATYLGCFIPSLLRVNLAYLRELIETGLDSRQLANARDENGGGPGVRLRKGHHKKS